MRVVLALSVCLSIPLVAQQPAFRSGTRLVRLDVTVLDRDRQPVRDLSPADFRVTEGNRVLAIRAFERVSHPTLTATSQARPEVPVPGKTAAVAAPDVTTPTDPERDMSGRLMVVVMDDDMTPARAKWEQQAKAIARSIVERMAPHDRMALQFTRAGRTRLDLTSNQADLLHQIDTFSAGGFLALPPTDTGIDEVPRYRRTMDTLTFTMESLASLTDRQKLIVYVGPGLPIDQTLGSTSKETAYHGDFARYMTSFYRDAQRANVVVYTFDPTGLEGLERYIGERYNIATRIRVRPTPGTVPIVETRQENPRSIARWMNDFAASAAENTGGRAFMNSELFQPAVDQMFADSSFYYLIAVEPADAVADGKFHQVRIRVDRPRVDVRARRGYYYEP